MIFISHRDINNRETTALMKALKLLHYSDESVFIDHDPENGIQAGTPWFDQLVSRIDASQAIIIVLTTEWNKSHYCRFELLHALAKHLKIIILRFPDSQDPAIRPDIEPACSQLQIIEVLDTDNTGFLQQQLRTALGEAHSPVVMSGFGPGTSPFAGIRALSEANSAGLIGREADSVTCIQQLHALQRKGTSALKIFCLTGLSASGKTSLLNAVVLPALRQDFLLHNLNDDEDTPTITNESKEIALIADISDKLTPSTAEIFSSLHALNSSFLVLCGQADEVSIVVSAIEQPNTAYHKAELTLRNLRNDVIDPMIFTPPQRLQECLRFPQEAGNTLSRWIGTHAMVNGNLLLPLTNYAIQHTWDRFLNHSVPIFNPDEMLLAYAQELTNSIAALKVSDATITKLLEGRLLTADARGLPICTDAPASLFDDQEQPLIRQLLRIRVLIEPESATYRIASSWLVTAIKPLTRILTSDNLTNISNLRRLTQQWSSGDTETIRSVSESQLDQFMALHQHPAFKYAFTNTMTEMLQVMKSSHERNQQLLSITTLSNNLSAELEGLLQLIYRFEQTPGNKLEDIETLIKLFRDLANSTEARVEDVTSALELRLAALYRDYGLPEEQRRAANSALVLLGQIDEPEPPREIVQLIRLDALHHLCEAAAAECDSVAAKDALQRVETELIMIGKTDAVTECEMAIRRAEVWRRLDLFDMARDIAELALTTLERNPNPEPEIILLKAGCLRQAGSALASLADDSTTSITRSEAREKHIAATELIHRLEQQGYVLGRNGIRLKAMLCYNTAAALPSTDLTAVAEFQSAIAMMLKLQTVDKGNPAVIADLAHYRQYLGLFLVKNAQVPQGAKHLTDSLSDYADLQERAPGHLPGIKALAEILSHLLHSATARTDFPHLRQIAFHAQQILFEGLRVASSNCYILSCEAAFLISRFLRQCEAHSLARSFATLIVATYRKDIPETTVYYNDAQEYLQ